MPLSNRVCFLVNLRDRLTCQQCGKSPSEASHYHRGFEYHHLTPRSQGGSDEANNIILLCHACHQQEHKIGWSRLSCTLETLDTFRCHHCQHLLNSQTVEMNCGWYQCDACQQQTHLFTHFFGRST
jgi:hypothetical protein